MYSKIYILRPNARNPMTLPRLGSVVSHEQEVESLSYEIRI
jgi:hypothetical protein